MPRKKSKQSSKSRNTESDDSEKFNQIKSILGDVDVTKPRTKILLEECNKWDIVFQILQYLCQVERKYVELVRNVLSPDEHPNNWRLEIFCKPQVSKEALQRLNLQQIIIDTNYFVKQFKDFNILINAYYTLIVPRAEANYNADFDEKAIYVCDNYETFIKANLSQLSNIFVKIWTSFTKFESKKHRARRARNYFSVLREEKIDFLRKHEELENIFVFNGIRYTHGDTENIVTLSYDLKRKLLDYNFVDPYLGFTMENWLKTVSYQQSNFPNKCKLFAENEELFYFFVLKHFTSDNPIDYELKISEMMKFALIKAELDILLLKTHLKNVAPIFVLYDSEYFLARENEFIDIDALIGRFVNFIVFVEEKYLRRLHVSNFNKFDSVLLHVTGKFHELRKWKQYRDRQVEYAIQEFCANPDIFKKYVNHYVAMLVPKCPKSPLLRDGIKFLEAHYERLVLDKHLNTLQAYAEYFTNLVYVNLPPLTYSILLPAFSLQEITKFQCPPLVNRSFFNFALRQIINRRFSAYRWHRVGNYSFYACTPIIETFIAFISIYKANVKLENCIDDFFKSHVSHKENYHSYTTKIVYISTSCHTDQILFINHLWDYFQIETLDLSKLKNFMQQLSRGQKASFMYNFMATEDRITYEIIRLVGPRKQLYNFFSDELQNILKRVLQVDNFDDINVDESIKRRRLCCKEHVDSLVDKDGEFFDFVSKIFIKWTNEASCSIHYMIQRIVECFKPIMDRILKIVEFFVNIYKALHPNEVVEDESNDQVELFLKYAPLYMSSMIENVVEMYSEGDIENGDRNIEIVPSEENANIDIPMLNEQFYLDPVYKQSNDVLRKFVLKCIRHRNNERQKNYKKRVLSSEVGEVLEDQELHDLGEEVFSNLNINYLRKVSETMEQMIELFKKPNEKSNCEEPLVESDLSDIGTSINSFMNAAPTEKFAKFVEKKISTYSKGTNSNDNQFVDEMFEVKDVSCESFLQRLAVVVDDFMEKYEKEEKREVEIFV